MIAYVINMSHRLDRLHSIKLESQKLPTLYLEVVEAVQHDTAWIGCFLSHQKCVQKAKDNNLDYVCILEDDAIFEQGADKVLKEAFSEMQFFKWDMLYLGANLQGPAKQVSRSLLKLTAAFAAHAYIVHSRMFDTILSLHYNKEIDVHYTDIMSKYNVFMCNPMIAYQLPSHSDLQNGFRDYNSWMYNNYITYKQ